MILLLLRVLVARWSSVARRQPRANALPSCATLTMCGHCACRSLLRLVRSCSEPLGRLAQNYKLTRRMGAAYGRYHWPFKLDQVGSRGMVQKGGSSAYLVANSPRDEAGPHVEHWTNCRKASTCQSDLQLNFHPATV